jgi:hypothetical protein
LTHQDWKFLLISSKFTISEKKIFHELANSLVWSCSLVQYQKFHKCGLRKSNLMWQWYRSCYVFSSVCVGACRRFILGGDWDLCGGGRCLKVPAAAAGAHLHTAMQPQREHKGKSLRSVIFNNKWERIVASSAAGAL